MISGLLLVAGLAMQAAAANTVKVTVGKDNTLSFAPNSFNASKGDTVEFHFYSKNHSVVQGDFDNPCQPAASGGFFSGFFPTNGTGANAQVFSVTLNDSNPLVFYCSQNVGTHCAHGMAGVINPTVSSSLSNYQASAQNAGQAGSPPSPFGGVVGPAPSGPTTTTPPPAGNSTTPTGTPVPTTSKPSSAGTIKASIGGLAAVALAAMCLV